MKKIVFGFMGILLPSFVFANSSLSSLEIESLDRDTFRNRVGNTIELGRFRIENNGRKKYLESIYFRNYGRSDLEESIEQAVLVDLQGEIVASGQPRGRYIQFVFQPDYILGERDSVIFRTQARLVKADRNDSIQLGIRRDEDLRATDISSGFGVPTNAEGFRLGTHELHPGNIYFTNNRSSQRARSYRGSNRTRLTPNTSSYRRLRTTSRRSYNPGTRDVLFFNKYVSSNRNISVDGVAFDITGSTSSGFQNAFGDMNLYINGRLEASGGSFTFMNGKEVLLFDASINIPAGQTRWQVSGRIQSGASTRDRIRLRLSESGLIDKEYY